jgi:hypothetical protein
LKTFVAALALVSHASLVLTHVPDDRAFQVIMIKSIVPSRYGATPASDDSSFAVELVPAIDETAIRLRFRALDSSRWQMNTFSTIR